MPRTLTPQVKNLYGEWLQQNGFQSRPSQIEMMTFIESIISQNRAKIGIVEAATGTGKTVAYAATAIPLAREQNKKVVVATATVTLQEQIVQRDLPSLRKATEIGFTFSLAKGRQRYVCPMRLERIVHPDISSKLLQRLDEYAGSSKPPTKQFEALWDAFNNMQWDGDRDNTPIKLTEEQWSPIITDSQGCTGKSCTSFSRCPYFLSRQNIRTADVVVTNYDHLLRSLQADSDIYPPLCDVVLICDEAHHLSSKVMTAFSARVAVNDSRALIMRVHGSLDRLQRGIADHAVIAQLVSTFKETYIGLLAKLEELKEYLKDCFRNARETETEYRFPNGNPKNEIREAATHLSIFYGGLATTISNVTAELKKIVENQDPNKMPQGIVEYLNELGGVSNHLNEATLLFEAYSISENRSACARWVTRSVDELQPEWVLHNVPIEIDKIVNPLIWDEVHAAICTSATLYAGDEFQHFIESTGLGEQAPVTLRIDSPFDLAKAVSLHIPNMQTLLTSQDQARLAHTREVIGLLPNILKQHKSGLVLFAARKTMTEVYEQLPKPLQRHCLIQQGTGVPTLLKEHRTRIDRGDRSYLFGVASLREGIDLPGDYCRHVVIAKLPFDVPDDPVIESKRELLQEDGVGRNELFMLLQLPPVILKLKQACGRLIRNEADYGQITILDIRVVKRGYGKRIFDSLPDYGIVTQYPLSKRDRIGS